MTEAMKQDAKVQFLKLFERDLECNFTLEANQSRGRSFRTSNIRILIQLALPSSPRK